MNDREQLKGRLAELEAQNRELQQNLAHVRNAEQEIMGRLNQNIGAQKELQRLLPADAESGEENTGEGEPAEADADSAGAENKPEAAAPETAPEPG